jgi:hypothetical protein
MKSTEEEGLDNIFKQGLKEPGHLADYRESDWDAFEQMLDEKEKKRPVIFWLRIASGIAAMLLLGFGWLYMQKANDGVKPMKQPLAVHTETKSNGSNTSNIAATKQTSPSAQNHTIAATMHNDNTGTSGGDEHQTAAGSNQTSLVGRTHVLAMDRHYQKDRSFLSLSGPATRRDNAGLVDNSAINRGNTEVLAALSESNIPQAKFSGDNDNTKVVAIENKDGKIIDVKTPVKRRPQFAITVLGSSNINGVSSFNSPKVGGSFGLQFSVTVSKFTFSTGASYDKAPYLTPFADYHTSYPFKYNPVNVSADCRVLDIPLNVDYRIYAKGRNQFSVGSGLSSYIMLNEDYHFNYAKPYNYTPTDYNVVNENQHFLGVLNLQATYQRKLNSKVSLAIQPYLKIPLTDIGYSQVRLQTAGVAVGLSWNLNSLAKP